VNFEELQRHRHRPLDLYKRSPGLQIGHARTIAANASPSAIAVINARKLPLEGLLTAIPGYRIFRHTLHSTDYFQADFIPCLILQIVLPIRLTEFDYFRH
jgi:hypothetical protein